MERLTFEGNFCDITQCRNIPGGNFCEDGACSQKKVWERLKAYEDTGLSPEKVSWMKEVVEEAFDNDTSRIERAHNLHVADKEGRVVVLPCKVGDKLYRRPKKPVPITVDAIRIDREGTTYITGRKRFCEDAIGRAVFLTEAEAEKALQKMEGKKDG